MFKKNNILCVVCSAGGHFTEALLAVSDLEYPRFFVTYRLPHMDESLSSVEHYYVTNPHKNLLKYAVNLFQSLRIYIRKRPRFVLSTGSGVAIATCLIGKLFGSRLIYVETGARVYSPSLTGRMLYYFSDLFIVQWPYLKRLSKKIIYAGRLF